MFGVHGLLSDLPELEKAEEETRAKYRLQSVFMMAAGRYLGAIVSSWGYSGSDHLALLLKPESIK